MALYRMVSSSFWTDSKVVDDFTPEDRYFYLYLFTNPHTNLCGCYEISFRQMVSETGYSRESVENLLKRFENVHNVIRYSQETKELLILKYHKYNWTKSEKYRKGVMKEVQNIKENSFKEYLLGLLEGDDTVQIPYPYPIFSPPQTPPITNTITDANTNANTNTVKTVSIPYGYGIEDRVAEKKPVAPWRDTVRDSPLSEPVKDKLLDFLEYRKEIKKPFKSERGVKALINQVVKQEQEHGSSAVIGCIDTTMQNGWQGLFWDRIDPGRSKPLTGADVYFEMAMEGRKT